MLLPNDIPVPSFASFGAAHRLAATQQLPGDQHCQLALTPADLHPPSLQQTEVTHVFHTEMPEAIPCNAIDRCEQIHTTNKY